MVFMVAWNCVRQTFAVLDEDGEMLGQSPDHARAVALAVKDAKTLRLIGVRACVVSRKPNGKLRQEWASNGDA
jgi:hypothetical protein